MSDSSRWLSCCIVLHLEKVGVNSGRNVPNRPPHAAPPVHQDDPGSRCFNASAIRSPSVRGYRTIGPACDA
jgi:hypothetical protein